MSEERVTKSSGAEADSTGSELTANESQETTGEIKEIALSSVDKKQEDEVESSTDKQKSAEKTKNPLEEPSSPSLKEGKAQKPAEEKSPSKSAETAMEADSTEAVASATTKETGDDEQVKEHLKLLGEGKKAFANNDFLCAADYFGRAAELSRTVYGELSEKNGETLFLYGATMLECWKSESTVLGENMKGKDDDEGYDDEEEGEDDEEQGEEEEKMEAESEATEAKLNGDTTEPTANGEAKTQNGENGHDEKGESEEKEQNEADQSSSNQEDKEDEDNYLRVAWEMLDLAKVIYHKVDDKKRLADTYMKLGEVAVESGHVTATDEMKKCLDLRQGYLEPHDRIIAETHFNIGVAFSVFKLFDEATKHFEKAKEILQGKMNILKDLNTPESMKEFAEIESIIPELNDKIQDMADSKRDELIKGKTADDSNGCSSSAGSTVTETKPASNIGHLIKRKRKMDDIVAEKTTKACRLEGEDVRSSAKD